MIEDLFGMFNRDNSYTDGRIHVFHEDLIYYSFGCTSLPELRELRDELVAEGLLTPLIRNFYATTPAAEEYIRSQVR